MLKCLRVAIGARGLSLVVAVIFLALCASADANDSSASLEIGGLRLTYNPDIELREEDLFLSRHEVRVAYEFFNKSNADVHTIVAFPLPAIENGEGGNYDMKSADPVNVIGFEVVVDGKPVKPDVEIRAISLGLDVTKLLEKYHLPLTTITPDADARGRLNDIMRDLPMDARRELETFGVIDWHSSFDKDGRPDANPRWKTNITFHWLQTFPAGRVVEIRHRYRPVPRDFVTSMREISSERMRRSYCVDGDFLRAAQAWGKAMGTMTGRELRYILSTAENWSGPIQKFRLTIDKASPEALVSLCFDGIKRTGPTTFAVTKENYQAVDDLGILLLDGPSDH